MKIALLATRLLAFAFAASGPLAFAETLIWTGGGAGTATGMSTPGNWSDGGGNTTAPSATSDLIIANTVNTTIPTLLLGANYTIKSITLDNAANKFSASNGLRIVSTTSSTLNTARELSFGTAGDIITLVNNASGSFRSASLSANSTANPLPSLSLNLAYTGQGNINIDASSELLLSVGSRNTDEAKVIGIGGITKQGAGTLSLSGIHTYGGGFILETGRVAITTSGAANGDGTAVANSGFGTGTLTLKGGAIESTTDTGRTIFNSVKLDGNVSITSNVSGMAGNFTVSTAAGQSTELLSASTLNIPGSAITNNAVVGGQVTWNQDISGAHSLTKTGAGTLVLNGTNTFTGGLNINAGTVTADSPVALGSSAALNPSSIVFNGGTLAFTAGSNSTLSSNRGIQIGGGNGTIDLSSGRNVEVLGDITNISGQSGQLIKTGSGTLTLSGNNSYTGSTTIQGGALVGNSNSLQGAMVLNNASSITFNQSVDGTYAGSLNGNGSFTKTGSATLFVTNQSSHTGLNTVDEGTLVLGHDAILGGNTSAGLVVNSGATLDGVGTINGNASLAFGAKLAVGTYSDGALSDRFGLLTFNANLDVSAAAGTAPTIPAPGITVLSGAFAFDLGSASLSDLVVVNGLLSIGTGVLDLGDFNFTSGGTFEVGTYTLFQSSQAIDGSLGSSLVGDFDGLIGTLAIAGNTIQLSLAAAPIPEPSTYALLFGVAAIGFAFRRRRAAR